MEAGDGCETPLDTLTDCGGCGVACAVAGGTASCASGVCEVAMCYRFAGDCNMDPTDGCETDLRADDMACGDCATSCGPGETCMNGRCR